MTRFIDFWFYQAPLKYLKIKFWMTMTKSNVLSTSVMFADKRTQGLIWPHKSFTVDMVNPLIFFQGLYFSEVCIRNATANRYI